MNTINKNIANSQNENNSQDITNLLNEQFVEKYVPNFIKELDPNGTNKMALFDADGTLWDGDVADDFTYWMIKNKGLANQEQWQRYLKIYQQDSSSGCQFLLTLFNGKSIDYLKEAVNNWWNNFSQHQWIPEVVSTLHYLHNKGYTIWVVSGTPTIFLDPVKKLLPIDLVIGMDFELSTQGLITGKCQGIPCTHQGKALKVKREKKVKNQLQDKTITFVAGNSELDIEMFKLSKEVKWAIHPDSTLYKYSKKKNWHILPKTKASNKGLKDAG